MQQRSPLTAALFGLFIPLYVMYWLYVTAKDMKSRGANPPPFWWLLVPLIGALFLVSVLIGMGVYGGHEPTGAALVIVVALLILIIPSSVMLSLYYYYKFSEVAETVTRGKVTKVAAFVLFIFIAPAVVYIVQDALNNLPTPAQKSS